MIEPEQFAQRQMELAAEFAKYLLENPAVDDALPEDAYIYFQVDGEPEFNAYSRELAERHEREESRTAVSIRVKGLAPPQGSRLIEPCIAVGTSTL
jgi:hypothetical protein